MRSEGDRMTVEVERPPPLSVVTEWRDFPVGKRAYELQKKRGEKPVATQHQMSELGKKIEKRKRDAGHFPSSDPELARLREGMEELKIQHEIALKEEQRHEQNIMDSERRWVELRVPEWPEKAQRLREAL